MNDYEYQERRRAENAEFALTNERIKNLETLATSVNDGLNKHVSHCAKLQTYGAVVGTGTLAWLIGHSPEAERILAKIISAFAQ